MHKLTTTLAMLAVMCLGNAMASATESAAYNSLTGDETNKHQFVISFVLDEALQQGCGVVDADEPATRDRLSADINLDGLINIDDLLIVIGNWG